MIISSVLTGDLHEKMYYILEEEKTHKIEEKVFQKYLEGFQQMKMTQKNKKIKEYKFRKNVKLLIIQFCNFLLMISHKLIKNFSAIKKNLDKWQKKKKFQKLKTKNQK